MPVVDFREVFDSFRRILIVDDETNVRLILRMTLETEGYEIFESTSGAHALQTLAKHSFALAILDLDTRYGRIGPPRQDAGRRDPGKSAGAQCELCGRLQNMRRLLDVETFGSCSAPIDLGCD
jgi:CheY-like chemotaxis protein